MGLDLAHRHAADDGGGALTARVAAGIGQHGDVRRQHGHSGQCVLIPPDDQTGEGGADHQKQQPGRTALVQVPHALLEVGLVGRADGVHLGDILAGLVLQDADGIVNGHDAHQPVFGVHHRNGQKAVFFKQVGNILLVGGGGHTDHIGVHQVSDGFCGVLGQHQRPQRHHAHQLAAAVGHIAVVDGLLVKAVLADGLHGLRHRHVRAQLHQLGGHHAAGRVLRVLEQFVDHAAGGGVGLAQNALDHIGRHLLHKVGRIVHAQLVHHGLQLGIGQAVDQLLLGGRGQLGEYIRRQVLGAQTKQHRELFGRQVLEHGGQVGSRQGLHHIPQALVFFGVIQIRQHGLEGIDRNFRHKKAASFFTRRQRTLSFPGKANTPCVLTHSRAVLRHAKRLPSGSLIGDINCRCFQQVP